jgi:hypothetical protein
MGVGILFNIINGSILRKKMINEIGEIYFFDFKKHSEVKKEGNYFTVMKHKKLKLIRNQLMSKCNFLNIVYEISRL